MSNILITGGNGFLGSRIVEELQKENNCKPISRKNNVDIKDYESFNNIDFEPEIIIHSAANLNDNIEEGFLSNTLGTFNICKYSKEKNVKHLILISSISIFNNIENGYFNNYGFSKKQAEDIAIRYCQENNIKLTILRCSQIYDERQNARKSQGMLYYFIDTIKEKREINIFGKKNPIRNYIFVEDVVNIIKNCTENKIYGIYNIINPKNHTITEIVYTIFDILNIKPNINYLKDKEDILSIYIPSDNLYPNYENYLDLQSGIKKIINYEK